MKLFTSLLLATIAVVPSFAQIPDDLRRKLEAAEKQIVRLQPSAFSEIPANVVRELERRRCTIPQEAFTKRRHNAIRGEFAKAGQTDYAVLCSVNGVSSILVFWNGSEKSPSAIAPKEDRDYLQGITSTEFGFSRGISVVGRDSITRHYQAYGGRTPPPINHHGIDDAFIEKGSVTWYFHDGKWLKLTGAD